MIKRTFQLIAALALVASASRAAAADPVKLLFAKTGIAYDGNYAWGAVEVQNLAYAKKVTVAYRVGTGAWTEAAATYLAPTHDGLEAWQWKTPSVQLGYKQSATVEFAIRYDVAGKTYWDSNGGANYKVGFGYDPVVPMELLVQSQLVLDTAYPSSAFASPGVYTWKSVSGSVWVKNLGYAKAARVVYTTDGWATVQDADAAYASTDTGGVERWSFLLAVPASTARVQFAVQYQVNGQTYWDNNFGSNYAVTF